MYPSPPSTASMQSSSQATNSQFHHKNNADKNKCCKAEIEIFSLAMFTGSRARKLAVSGNRKPIVGNLFNNLVSGNRKPIVGNLFNNSVSGNRKPIVGNLFNNSN